MNPWGDDVNLLIKLKDVKFTSSRQGFALCTDHLNNKITTPVNQRLRLQLTGVNILVLIESLFYNDSQNFIILLNEFYNWIYDFMVILAYENLELLLNC